MCESGFLRMSPSNECFTDDTSAECQLRDTNSDRFRRLNTSHQGRSTGRNSLTQSFGRFWTGGYEPIVGCLLDGSTRSLEGKHPSLVDFLGDEDGVEWLCLLIHVDPDGGQYHLCAPNRWCADADRLFRWPVGWSVCVRWFGWLRGTDKDRIWFPPYVI